MFKKTGQLLLSGENYLDSSAYCIDAKGKNFTTVLLVIVSFKKYYLQQVFSVFLL
jgi:hypothetical protein